MIEIQLYRGTGGNDVALARYNGLVYRTERRDGALPELARRLVMAGAYGPWRTSGGSLRASGQSLRRLAGMPEANEPEPLVVLKEPGQSRRKFYDMTRSSDG